MGRLLFGLIFASMLVLSSCDSLGSVPDGRIRIKNDFSGTEYSSYDVSGGGASYHLNAGEYALLPAGTTDISFTYQARDGLRMYSVQCPSNLKGGITIKVIDVHSNRIAGGCKTVWANHEGK